MIRTMRFLFCDNEHGTGDVTFPDTDRLESQAIIGVGTAKGLRQEARKEGWKRIMGADYCPTCVDSIEGR